MHHHISYRTIDATILFMLIGCKETLCCQFYVKWFVERRQNEQKRENRERAWMSEQKESELETKVIKARKSNSQRGGMRVYWMLFYSRFSSIMWYLCWRFNAYVSENHRCAQALIHTCVVHECDLCAHVRKIIYAKKYETIENVRTFFSLFHFYLSLKRFFFLSSVNIVESIASGTHTMWTVNMNIIIRNCTFTESIQRTQRIHSK